MMLRTLLVAALVAVAQPAAAGTLRVRVVDANGQAVPDAVVTLHPAAGAPRPTRFSWPMRIEQREMQFHPFVLIAPPGATVAFPNLDSVRHHVYSFSEAGPFELRLYGRDDSRTVSFNNAGIIAIGCNIHDSMTAFIFVADTPYAMKTDANGYANLADAPAGAARLSVWHPYLRTPNNRMERQITAPTGDSAQAFEVRLRRPPQHSHAY